VLRGRTSANLAYPLDAGKGASERGTEKGSGGEAGEDRAGARTLVRTGEEYEGTKRAGRVRSNQNVNYLTSR